MGLLRDVHFWPLAGPEAEPWDPDEPNCDAFVRTSRRVCERYSDALRKAELSNRSSSVRFFVGQGEPGDVEVAMSVDPSDSESGRVTLPPAATTLDAGYRAALVLETVHGGMMRLGQARGWDPERLNEAHAAVIAHRFEFSWDSPWKTSRTRKHKARLRFSLQDNGFGIAILEVTDVKTAQVLRSEAVPSFSTIEGFQRSARTLRWAGAESVEAVPWVGLFGTQAATSRWSLSQLTATEPDVVWPPEPTAPAKPVVSSGLGLSVMGVGRSAPEQPHEIRFCGHGLTNGMPREYEQTLDQLLCHVQVDPAWADWWRNSPVRLLEITGTWDGGFGPPLRQSYTVRRYAHHITAIIQRSTASMLDGAEGVDQAHRDVTELLARVRERAGLDQPPRLPLDG
ncbi:hypothetical protein [Branchiibius sp. NY16-3462-2]|uniref:hypothetical protein n=1 Tax=Branchiibius sp. NY16-3462-2 TaxID=1807500 RepID=UPI00079251D2|nr:hypothetical protein [Branchiibius sp. NY16-3462-2]KYH43376.1 hypothetical protein AZH51_16580 [Branchiibius sp. NY16-3462-2]